MTTRLGFTGMDVSEDVYEEFKSGLFHGTRSLMVGGTYEGFWEDAYQDGWVRLLRYIAKNETVNKPFSLAWKIGCWASMTKIKRESKYRQRFPQLPNLSPSLPDQGDIEPPGDLSDNWLASKEAEDDLLLSQLLGKISDLLSDRQWCIYVLTYLGYRQVEIAEALKVAKSTINKELTKIQKTLANNPFDDDPRDPAGGGRPVRLSRQRTKGNVKTTSQRGRIVRKPVAKLFDIPIPRNLVRQFIDLTLQLPAFSELNEKTKPWSPRDIRDVLIRLGLTHDTWYEGADLTPAEQRWVNFFVAVRGRACANLDGEDATARITGALRELRSAPRLVAFRGHDPVSWKGEPVIERGDPEVAAATRTASGDCPAIPAARDDNPVAGPSWSGSTLDVQPISAATATAQSGVLLLHYSGHDGTVAHSPLLDDGQGVTRRLALDHWAFNYGEAKLSMLAACDSRSSVTRLTPRIQLFGALKAGKTSMLAAAYFSDASPGLVRWVTSPILELPCCVDGVASGSSRLCGETLPIGVGDTSVRVLPELVPPSLELFHIAYTIYTSGAGGRHDEARRWRDAAAPCAGGLLPWGGAVPPALEPRFAYVAGFVAGYAAAAAASACDPSLGFLSCAAHPALELPLSSKWAGGENVISNRLLACGELPVHGGVLRESWIRPVLARATPSGRLCVYTSGVERNCGETWHAQEKALASAAACAGDPCLGLSSCTAPPALELPFPCPIFVLLDGSGSMHGDTWRSQWGALDVGLGCKSEPCFGWPWPAPLLCVAYAIYTSGAGEIHEEIAHCKDVVLAAQTHSTGDSCPGLLAAWIASPCGVAYVIYTSGSAGQDERAMQHGRSVLELAAGAGEKSDAPCSLVERYRNLGVSRLRYPIHRAVRWQENLWRFNRSGCDAGVDIDSLLDRPSHTTERTRYVARDQHIPTGAIPSCDSPSPSPSPSRMSEVPLPLRAHRAFDDGIGGEFVN
jgi:DNA-directed RNA polymerase specialized sigma24 family protein